MYFNLGYDQKFPEWFNVYFMNMFSRGIFTTATFMVVMYLGVITKHNKLSRKLMSVRGEISIIGSLLTLSHNVVFGVKYFPMLFTNPKAMPTRELIASTITLCLLAMLIPLFVTSFKSVRRKMSGKTWKKIQRFAYLFYGLIYVHVMLIMLPVATTGNSQYILNVLIYSLVFITYAVMRINKALNKKSSTKVQATIN